MEYGHNPLNQAMAILLRIEERKEVRPQIRMDVILRIFQAQPTTLFLEKLGAILELMNRKKTAFNAHSFIKHLFVLALIFFFFLF
jgi:hypothetical protein